LGEKNVTRETQKTPIKEAIVDIQVAFNDNIDIKSLDFYDAIKDKFATREEIFLHSSQIKFDSRDSGSPKVEQNTNLHGYKYTSNDKDFVVQSTINGLTISNLVTYCGWDNLIALSRHLLSIYGEFTKPISTTRIAVRYINNLELPLPVDSLRDWLKDCPVVPGLGDNCITGFFHRTLANIGNNQIIYTQALEPIKHDKILPVIIDTDVYSLKTLNLNDETVWETCSELRDIKNKIFFNSITEKTLELYL
jgi:uncharacterized protein (TIGR04255 family)